MTVKIINANEASRNVTAVMTNDMKKIIKFISDDILTASQSGRTRYIMYIHDMKRLSEGNLTDEMIVDIVNYFKIVGGYNINYEGEVYNDIDIHMFSSYLHARTGGDYRNITISWDHVKTAPIEKHDLKKEEATKEDELVPAMVISVLITIAGAFLITGLFVYMMGAN